MSSSVARQRPVRLFLSGPAAGVVGGLEAARAAGFADLITVDIGGTSCDIALITGGAPLIRGEGVIDGYPVRVPMVDVTAIGSGGGSIAWLDGAGSLKVGPHSAGLRAGSGLLWPRRIAPDGDRRLGRARLYRPGEFRRRNVDAACRNSRMGDRTGDIAGRSA